ncbi:MAG: hypothetical protein IH947_12555, partial [Bacteroidetes bacterium]|nr:hypothetical protein [Bacteroidota bacterium]
MSLVIDQKKLDLLLRQQLNQEQAANFLQSLNFKDWKSANRSLLRMAETEEIISHLKLLLPFLLNAISSAANPNHSLINFEQFLSCVPDKSKMLRYLIVEPRTIEILITLFAGSQFLTEILFRHPEYFDQLKDRKKLALVKNVHQLYAEAGTLIDSMENSSQKLDKLRRFQRKELLRIGAG